MTHWHGVYIGQGLGWGWSTWFFKMWRNSEREKNRNYDSDLPDCLTGHRRMVIIWLWNHFVHRCFSLCWYHSLEWNENHLSRMWSYSLNWTSMCSSSRCLGLSNCCSYDYCCHCCCDAFHHLPVDDVMNLITVMIVGCPCRLYCGCSLWNSLPPAAGVCFVFVAICLGFCLLWCMFYCRHCVLPLLTVEF